jgi:hypothetical protein
MMRPRLAVPVLLLAAAALLAPSAPGMIRPDRDRETADTIRRTYDIQLAFTGYTGLAESQDCEALASQQGYDSLVGTVVGIESTGRSDEDVVYTGRLRRVVKLDYCLTTGGDQAKWCVVSLTGAARTQVELTVYGEADRGAWLKAQPDSLRPRPDSARVSGTCPQAEKNTIQADFPSGESGGSPDGQPIAETNPPRFFVNGIPRLRVGHFPPDAAEGGWGLRVVRASP